MKKLFILPLLAFNFLGSLFGSDLFIKNGSNWQAKVTTRYKNPAQKTTITYLKPFNTLETPNLDEINLGNVLFIEEVIIEGTSLEKAAGFLGALRFYAGLKVAVNMQDVQDLAQQEPNKNIAAVIDVASYTGKFILQPLQLQDQEDSGLTVPKPALQDLALPYAPLASKQDAHISSLPLSYGISIAQGSKPRMEDAHTVVIPFSGNPQMALFGVFDGFNTDEISHWCVRRLAYNLEHNQHISYDIKRALHESIEQTDTDLASSSLKDQAFTGGTAVLVALLNQDKFYVANVGTSRALLSLNGQLRALSIDQKTDRPDEAQRIKNAGGSLIPVTLPACSGSSTRESLYVDNQMSMTRALGAHTLRSRGIIATPEILEVTINSNTQFLILATQGLFQQDCMSRQDAITLVQNTLNKYQQDPAAASKAAQALVDDATRRGSTDNLTALVIVFDTKQLSGASQSHALPVTTSLDSNTLVSTLPITTYTNSLVQKSSSLAYGFSESIGRRPTMEDAHILAPNFSDTTSLFAIFDGHGGHKVAEYVAENLPTYLKDSPAFPQDLQTTLKDGLEKTTSSLENSQKFSLKAQHMGTTAIVALIQNKDLVVANIGDSRAVLCRNGEALALSEDQKPERADEANRIKTAGGFIIQLDREKEKTIIRTQAPWNPHMPLRITTNEAIFGGLSMTRSIGDFALRPAGLIALPEISSTQLQNNDEFLILACDGIFEKNLERQEAVTIVREALNEYKGDPQAATLAAQKLVEAAYDKGSSDNLTALVVLLNQ